jgi:hypothetical protein
MAIGEFSICEERCKDFVFTDETGLFNAGENPQGWDKPVLGPFAASVTADSADITFPDGHTVNVILLDGTIPFPAADYPMKTITNVDAGLDTSSKWPSGKYTIKRMISLVSVPGNVVNYEQILDYWIDCQIECCVKKLYNKIPKNAALCDGNGPRCTADKAYDKMIGARYAFECGDYNGANLLRDQAEEICTTNQCSC